MSVFIYFVLDILLLLALLKSLAVASRDSLIEDYFHQGYPYQLIVFSIFCSRNFTIFETIKKDFKEIGT